MDEILFVNIGYENGLFTFKNDDICSQIPEGVMVNTPFYNQENSLEELVDTISMEPEENVVFAFRHENQKLVKKLAHLLAAEYGKTIYLVNTELDKNLCYEGEDYAIYLLGSYEALERIDEIAIKTVSELPELLGEDSDGADAGYYMAMRNGYDAFLTGVYPENMSNTLAKHVQLEADVEMEDVSQYLDINGALILRGDKDCRIEIKDKEYFNHLHVIGDNEVRFDSGVSFKHIVCTYSQFAEWKECGAVSAEYEYYLRIENEKDLEGFARELEIFQESARIDAVSKRLVDECRWTNQCSLKRLTRYRVDEEGVKPCMTSDKTLLDLQAESTMQLLEANKLCDKTIIQRKCVECAMNAVCSKCACLPGTISQEKYCEFVHKYPFVSEYLLKKRIVNFLSRFSKIFAGEAFLEVSSNVHCFEYPNEKKAAVARRSVHIFRKGEEYFVLHMQKGTLMKIEEKYVFLLEAWALEEEIAVIAEKAAEKYALSFETAERVVEEGYQHLKKGGLIS